MEEYLCDNCSKDVEVTGLGECPYCGADLRAASSLNLNKAKGDVE